MERRLLSYNIKEVEPYINWLYFYYANGVGAASGAVRGGKISDFAVRGGKSEICSKISSDANIDENSAANIDENSAPIEFGNIEDERRKLREDAERMLEEFDRQYHTHAVVCMAEANGDGDDIVINTPQPVRLPMLRQQKPDPDSGYCLCLADFLLPLESGKTDRIALFAATVDAKTEYDDPYRRMLAQTLADRLAEATVEKIHEEVREKDNFQGIRPAVGYPSMPDMSVNFILNDIIGMDDIGISLTESGMMRPHASVSGLMLHRPETRYFNIGNVGADQLADYARRRNVDVADIKRFIK